MSVVTTNVLSKLPTSPGLITTPPSFWFLQYAPSSLTSLPGPFENRSWNETVLHLQLHMAAGKTCKWG